MSGNDFTVTGGGVCGLPVCAGLKNLTLIDFSKNNFSGPSLSSRSFFKGSTKLTHVDLSENQLSGTVEGFIYRPELTRTAKSKKKQINGARTQDASTPMNHAIKF